MKEYCDMNLRNAGCSIWDIPPIFVWSCLLDWCRPYSRGLVLNQLTKCQAMGALGVHTLFPSE